MPHDAPHVGGRPRADDGVYYAISDPTRRAILDQLAQTPQSAGVIADAFAISRPAVSKHLGVLASAGLVRAHRVGRRRVYELDANPLREIDLWVSRYRTLWAARLVAIKREVEAPCAAAAATSVGGDGDPPGVDAGPGMPGEVFARSTEPEKECEQ